MLPPKESSCCSTVLRGDTADLSQRPSLPPLNAGARAAGGTTSEAVAEGGRAAKDLRSDEEEVVVASGGGACDGASTGGPKYGDGGVAATIAAGPAGRGGVIMAESRCGSSGSAGDGAAMRPALLVAVRKLPPATPPLRLRPRPRDSSTVALVVPAVPVMAPGVALEAVAPETCGGGGSFTTAGGSGTDWGTTKVSGRRGGAMK